MTPPIDCHAALQRLWDSLDGELTDGRVADARAHLTTCERCLPHARFAQHLLTLLASARDTSAASPQLRAQVFRVLREAGFTPD